MLRLHHSYPFLYYYFFLSFCFLPCIADKALEHSTIFLFFELLYVLFYTIIDLITRWQLSFYSLYIFFPLHFNVKGIFLTWWRRGEKNNDSSFYIYKKYARPKGEFNISYQFYYYVMKASTWSAYINLL